MRKNHNFLFLVCLIISCQLLSAQDDNEIVLSCLKYFPAAEYGKIVFCSETGYHFDTFSLLPATDEYDSVTTGLGLVVPLSTDLGLELKAFTAGEIISPVFDKKIAERKRLQKKCVISNKQHSLNYWLDDCRIAVVLLNEKFAISNKLSIVTSEKEFEIYSFEPERTIYLRPGHNTYLVTPDRIFIYKQSDDKLLISCSLPALKQMISPLTDISFLDSIFHIPFIQLIPELGHLWQYDPGLAAKIVEKIAYSEGKVTDSPNVESKLPLQLTTWFLNSDNIEKWEFKFFEDPDSADQWVKMQNAPVYNNSQQEAQEEKRTGYRRGEAFVIQNAGVIPYSGEIIVNKNR